MLGTVLGTIGTGTIALGTAGYLAFKYGKGKGKRPQAFPMAGGAPPQ